MSTREPKRAKEGFTLVETLIAIGLFTVLTGIALGGFAEALHTQGEAAALISSQSTVSLAIEQMAREARTGYLFCHTPANASGQQTDTCGCNEGHDSMGRPVWTCSELTFTNANGENVAYSLQGGALMRSDSAPPQNGAAEPLTGTDIFVRGLSFRLFGHLEGDGWTPRVTIAIQVSPSSTDPAIENDILNFETSVSARQIDCYIDGIGISHC